ncbi:MAG: hypothetical protein QM606_07025, partial [Leucobacter sp.]
MATTEPAALRVERAVRTAARAGNRLLSGGVARVEVSDRAERAALLGALARMGVRLQDDAGSRADFVFADTAGDAGGAGGAAGAEGDAAGDAENTGGVGADLDGTGSDAVDVGADALGGAGDAAESEGDAIGAGAIGAAGGSGAGPRPADARGPGQGLAPVIVGLDGTLRSARGGDAEARIAWAAGG